jgi:hypothetical protein
MRKIVLTTLMSLVWLLASPTLQLHDSSWVEVGAPPATAQTVQDTQPVPDTQPAQVTKDAPNKPATDGPKHLGSTYVVKSNQPRFHRMPRTRHPKRMRRVR